MRARVGKWGNSLALRIPAAVAAAGRLSDGDAVEVTAEDGYLVIRKTGRELTLADMLSRMTDENLHEPIDFGPPVGKELL